MAISASPKNTYNPRGDAAKLLSYRPNGAVITDDDGAFLAVRPIILNLNSFDTNGNFVANDHTLAYLRKIESEVMTILSEAGSSEDLQTAVDFGNDAIMARVAPLVERIRFAIITNNRYVSDTATFFTSMITDVDDGDTAMHVIIVPANNKVSGRADGIDLTTMMRYNTPVS